MDDRVPTPLLGRLRARADQSETGAPTNRTGDLCNEAADEIERLGRTIGNLERPLRAWLEMQSRENAHILYEIGLKHFGIKPVIPD